MWHHSPKAAAHSVGKLPALHISTVLSRNFSSKSRCPRRSEWSSSRRSSSTTSRPSSRRSSSCTRATNSAAYAEAHHPFPSTISFGDRAKNQRTITLSGWRIGSRKGMFSSAKEILADFILPVNPGYVSEGSVKITQSLVQRLALGAAKNRQAVVFKAG